MGKNELLTKILAVAGAIFAWLPIVAPVLFSAVRLIQGRFFLFDYLMPAELFPVALAGGGLLLWASLRAHAYGRPIIGGLVGAVVLLFGFQWLAVVTGLASGAIEPQGIWWTLVQVGLALYIVALISVGVGGVLLVRHLFGRGELPTTA